MIIYIKNKKNWLLPDIASPIKKLFGKEDSSLDVNIKIMQSDIKDIDKILSIVIYNILLKTKEYWDLANESPLGVSTEEWNTAIDIMIEAFRILSLDNLSPIDYTDEQMKIVNEGKQLFVMYYEGLKYDTNKK